ncbi:MAG: biotin--[acetyl-CoA-carboxylase] ligase [Elusimicrobiota bacterium]|jgi:BirA family biotin operon repressor/biotin-[acetyl-CoA-carboxylase] ligase|nr:biotin--[acetyl-CoA-carboxylase] ligase [Elusimicrobiota bacterium]
MYDIVEFGELASTNNYVKENSKVLKDKTIIVATRQTNGRGRFDRQWISEEGGLYFTIFLKPEKTDFLINLTQLMSVAVCRALNMFEVNAYIKWPNDVLVRGEKICGILSEAVITNDKIEGLALGAGINVSQKNLDNINAPAVSLKTLGVNAEKKDLLNKILFEFFKFYDCVIQKGFIAIREEYINLFPAFGSFVKVGAGEHAAGIIKDIDAAGRLVLQDGKGIIRTVLTGEII